MERGKEQAEMSKGQKNGYQCRNPRCGHLLITIDLDDGVTPMMKRCPTCGEMATSLFYRIDQSLPIEGYWYRPKSTRGMSREMRQHVEQGGLDYRDAGGRS